MNLEFVVFSNSPNSCKAPRINDISAANIRKKIIQPRNVSKKGAYRTTLELYYSKYYMEHIDDSSDYVDGPVTVIDKSATLEALLKGKQCVVTV